MPVPGRQLLRGPPAVAMDVSLGDGAHRMPRDKTAFPVAPLPSPPPLLPEPVCLTFLSHLADTIGPPRELFV